MTNCSQEMQPIIIKVFFIDPNYVWQPLTDRNRSKIVQEWSDDHGLKFDSGLDFFLGRSCPGQNDQPIRSAETLQPRQEEKCLGLPYWSKSKLS